MEVYRITQEIFSEDLTGNGAKLFGGRWNSAGISALYAASSRSLALLETLAHTPPRMLQLKSYMLSVIEVPDAASQEIITIQQLPGGWDATGYHDFTTRTGDGFMRASKKLFLCVPSVLMPEENIYVINPRHADMENVRIISKRVIRFDPRIENNLQ